MGSGGSKATTQTTTQTLTPEQQQLIGLAIPGISQVAQSGIHLPTESGVAGFDPLQTFGQNQVLGSTGSMSDILGSAAGANQFLTSGQALDPSTNKYLQATIDASTRPIWQGLTESALPNVRSEARSVGQVGGSRQGIAEGLAIRGAEQAAGDTSAKVATQGYLAGLEGLSKGIGLAPTTAASQAIPGLTTSGVGDVRQQQAQQQLSEEQNRAMLQQILPLLLGKDIAGIAAGLPGGSVTSTGKTDTTLSPLQVALAGGSILASMFGGKGSGGAIPG